MDGSTGSHWTLSCHKWLQNLFSAIPAGLPSRGGDVTVYVFIINQHSLPIPFCSVLVPLSVFMALSAVFHSINSPDNSPFSHSVLPDFMSALLVLSTTYLFIKVSLNGLRDVAYLPCNVTLSGEDGILEIEVSTDCSLFGPVRLFGPDFSLIGGRVGSTQSICWSC